MVLGRRKPSSGRRKIEIKRIADDGARQVCFSKRRAGVFKKAHDLSVLCGAEVALLVFSPAGRPFSFGHPSVDRVASAYLSGAGTAPHRARLWASPAAASVLARHKEKLAELEALRKKKSVLEEALTGKLGWSLDGLGLAELGMLEAALKELQREVDMQQPQQQQQQQLEMQNHTMSLGHNSDGVYESFGNYSNGGGGAPCLPLPGGFGYYSLPLSGGFGYHQPFL